MHVAVKVVTQPVHGADGKVTHRPGEQFAEDEVLPEGVWWRWDVAEVPDPKPAKEPAAKAEAKADAKAAAAPKASAGA